jgi:eukaryotic-like serine/threonine-protein kinase
MDVTRRVVAGWILEERLGSGGFGEVWKARRRHVDLFRALKLMPISGDGAFASWRHEIGRLEALSHPNIVRFYDADVIAEDGPYRDFAWIATELCERSLADELIARRGRGLTSVECAQLLDSMLAALAAAHEDGCVHRDIKPGNILLHSSGVWKLCDFGTARLLPQGESHPRTAVVGTFPYMSPAAHHGRQDRAADLYALGVTVHEALCGRRLHPRPENMTDSEYVKFVLDTPPVISPQLDSQWQEIVATLIGARGDFSARELHAELRRVYGSITSRPATNPDSYGTTGVTPPGQPLPPWSPESTTELLREAQRQLADTGTGTGITASSPPTRRHSRPPTPTPPARRDRDRHRRDKARVRSPRGNGAAGLLALVVLILSSVGVAGALLYTLVPNPMWLAGILAGVLLVTLLLMAVF